MYSSSTSSSSQGNSLGPSGGSNGGGLVRYGSAPSSLLSNAVDSLMNPDGGDFSGYGLHMGPSSHAPPSASRLFFSSSESSSQHVGPKTSDLNNGGLQRAYGFAGSSAPPPPPLVRHRSSPAGFLNQLAHAACTSNDENGFSTHGVTRLNSQMSFTRQEALSLISEESEDDANEKRKSAQAYNAGNYGGGGASWEDPHTIMFSMGPSKRPKDMSSEMISGLNGMESQIQFGMPETMLEMASMDKLLNIPEDSVPCKIRAKRGCATHPRSIAERERRTRISGKLKKLHDLVPNMDKQTSYADMLDLAVQHIKGLQDHVQKLNNELDNCTCGCRRPNHDSTEERR